MRLTEVANDVIALAAAANRNREVELRKRHPHYPFVDPQDGPDPVPAEGEKLKELLARLPDDVVYKLAAVMRVGRGDIEAGEAAGRYASMRAASADAGRVAAEMADKPALAEYLADGLAELSRGGIDADRLAPIAPVGANG